MNEPGNKIGLDTVIVEQLFGSGSGSRSLEPEKELMLAILADAIECYAKQWAVGDEAGTRLFREAKEWLFSEEGSQPFSFLDICDALDLSPGFIRRGIRSWRSNRFAAQANSEAVDKPTAAAPVEKIRPSLSAPRFPPMRRATIKTKRPSRL